MPYLLLTLATLFWSGNFVLSRAMHTEIPPVGLAFWRWTAALLILAPVGMAFIWKERSLLLQNAKWMLTQGLLGVTGFNTLIYLAMQSTTAINAVLVNSCIPIIIVIVSWFMYREKITLLQGVGVIISLGGVLLILAKGEVSALLQLEFNRGDLLVLGAAVVWACYSANLKKYPRGLHPIGYLTAMIIIGLFFLVPFYWLEIQSGRIVVLNKATVFSVLYLAVFASVLAFISWNKAVREVGANKAGPFIHLMPVFSTILAIIFLGEKLFGYQLRGIFFVFSGIVLASVAGRRARG
jgi:drug/metabolite transporter (DMT)-like permease